MKTIVGLFERYEDADAAIQELYRRGFNNSQINVLARERVVQDRLVSGPKDQVAQGMGAGATTGAVVGGLGGLLVGIGALAIPGIGPAYAVGTLAATLSATAGGAGIGIVTGSMIGALASWGLPEEEAHVYAESVKRGGILLAVQTFDEGAPQVQSVLHDAQATDINVLRERLQNSGWTKFTAEADMPEREPVATSAHSATRR